jgi:ribosomal protein L19E
MYATITSLLAQEHVETLRAQAASDRRARQARQARRGRRAGHVQVRHEISARRPQAAARHA